MGFGMAITGIFNPIGVIEGLPEMVESAMPKYDKSVKRRVNNLSSGIFNGMLGFGQIVAPAYGSFISGKLGFRWTCDIVAIVTMIFGFLYLIIGNGCQAFKKSSCSNQKK